MEEKADMEDLMTEITTVMVKIYSSCDVDETNSVKVSQLIGFIKPYFNELAPLECLRQTLDPENKDICVSSEVFYKTMKDWASKISSYEEENDSFCGSPCRLENIDKDVMYNQSTPRASYGQKLLNSSIELLNLSNVSSYSTNGNNKTVGPDVTMYEERIKMLQFEIGKCKSEMGLMKNQLTNFEEQNENLQLDLVKCNKKLHSEQLEKENLLQQIKELEELRDELSSYRKKIDDLKRQKKSCEKGIEKLSNEIQEKDESYEKLERKNEGAYKREQELKKQLYTIKLDLDSKENKILELNQLNEDLSNCLNQSRDLISCMEVEIEELKAYRKSNEKTRHSQLNSPSFIYKNAIECYSNYPLYTSDNFSPPHRPITPPTATMSPIPIWRAKSTENLMSVENGSLNLRRRVLNKRSSTSSNLSKSILNFEDGAGDAETMDDSFSKHQEFMKIIGTEFNKRDSLQAEFFKVKDNVGCKCRLLLEEKEKIINDLQDSLNEHLEKCKDQEKQLLTLNMEISKFKITVEDEKISLKMENIDLQEKLCILESQIADLDCTKADMEYNNLKTTTELKEIQTEKDQISFEKLLMETKVKQLDRDMKLMKKTVEEKNLEIENMKEKTTELEKYVFFEDLSKKLEKKINEKNEALKILESENAKLKRKAKNINEELNCKTIEEKNSAFKLLTNEIDNLKEAVEKKDVEIQELKENIKSSTEWKKLLQDQLQSEIYDKTLKIQQLCDENSTLKTSMADLKTELLIAMNNKEDLARINTKVMETIKQLEDHLKEKSLIVSSLNEMKDKLLNSLSCAENNVETKMHEVMQLKERLQKDLLLKNDLWSEMKKMESENNELKQQKNEFNSLRVQYGIFKSNLELLQKEFDEKTDEFQDIVKERDSYIEKYNDKNDIVKNQEALIKSLEKKIEEEQEKNLPVRLLEINLQEKDRKINHLESYKAQLKQDHDNYNTTIDKVIEKLLKMCNEDFNGLERLQKLENLVDKCTEKDENNNDLVGKIIEKLSAYQTDGNIDKKASPIEKIDLLVKDLSKQYKDTVKKLEKLKMSYEFVKTCMEKNEPVKRTTSETNFHSNKNNFAKQQLKIDRLEERLENAAKRLDASEKKCTKSEEMLSKKVAELKTIMENLKEKDIEIAKLKSDLSQYEIQKIQLEKSLLVSKNSEQLKNSEIENFKVDLNNLQHDKQIVEQRLMIRNKETADLYANYNDLKKRFDENQDFLREFETENAQLTQEKYDLMSQEDLLKEELTLKNGQLLKARKDLVEVTCKTDDLKSLNEAEEKLKGALGLLKTSEMELKSVKNKVDKLKEEISKFDEQMKGRNGVLLTGRQELGRILIKVSNVLRKTDDILSYNEIYEKLFNEVTAGNFNETSSDLEVEVQKLGKQIKVAVFLLEIVAIRFPKHMDLSDPTNCESDNPEHRLIVPDVSNKNLKRFTLRPATLVVSRPMSPDSPSLDVEEADLHRNGPESPDSKESFLKSFEESFNTADGDHSHYKCNDSDHFCSDFDLQQPFPNLNDSFLEQLGLHETSELKHFSKEETEKLFTTLVIQLAIDSKDYQERRSKQKKQCVAVHDKMLKLLREVNCRLRDHKCIGASDSIKPIFIIIEEARHLVHQVATSCVQYGVVSYEGRMTKCWNLVTNYLAQLRQEVVAQSSQSTVVTPTKKMVDSPTQTTQLRKRRSLQTVAEETQEVARGPSYSIFVMSCITISAILLFITSMVHVQCRMVSSDSTPCPLDFLMQKTIHGPTPF